MHMWVGSYRLGMPVGADSMHLCVGPHRLGCLEEQNPNISTREERTDYRVTAFELKTELGSSS